MGDPEFELEALGHLDSVYRVALWLCGDPVEAQDLTQDTYERALRAQAGFTRTNMRGWLLTILRNRFLNVRRQWTVRGETALEEAGGAATEAIPDVPPALVRRDVEAALARLPEGLRLPLVLADVEDLRMEEIAGALGWPVGTVKSRLWRARRELGTGALDGVKGAGVLHIKAGEVVPATR